MRWIVTALLLLVPAVATPCVMESEPVPPEIAAQGFPAVLRYRMHERFTSASAVFEATVLAIEELPDDDNPMVRAKLRVGRTWKADGGDLSTVVTSRTNCGANLRSGVTYVIFASRDMSFWSFLPWVDDTLYVGFEGAAWIRFLNNFNAQKFEDHRFFVLDPLADVLHAPELAHTPSN